MEVPLRTAYGQNGRCGMQPKAKHSLRAQAQLMRTETVKTETLEKKLGIRENARGFPSLQAAALADFRGLGTKLYLARSTASSETLGRPLLLFFTQATCFLKLVIALQNTLVVRCFFFVAISKCTLHQNN
ncbi:hypothetical protein TNCV_3957581 [Trichonephila clavipes]|nr:hypothetical protein TNCV_3957581 [Trichonephila clavipes]